jgi:ATP-binding cassette subfamily C protein LapB
MSDAAGSTPAALVWAVDKYYQLRGSRMDRHRLADAVAMLDAGGADWAGLSRVLKEVELADLRVLAQPDAARLPLLAHIGVHGWGVVVRAQGPDDWLIQTPGGDVSVPVEALRGCVAEIELPELGGAQGGEGGKGSEGPPKNSFSRALRKAFSHRRTALTDVVLGSLAINVISMALSFYSMQVYDRVIPTQGLSTLQVLTIGTLLALAFEFALKVARSGVMDAVVISVDAYLSRHIFERLLSVRVDKLPGSVGTLAAQMRGYEQVRSFYTSSTLFALIDLPIGLMFMAVIVALSGPLVALVPLTMLLAAVVNGLVFRARFNALALTGSNLSNKKTGILVEAVEGAETIKAGAGGWKFLQRWMHVSRAALQNESETRYNNDQLNYVTAVLTQLSYIGIVTIGAWQAMEGHLTTGGLIAASILGGRAMAPIATLPSLLVQHAQAKAATQGLERLYALETDDGDGGRPLLPSALHGKYWLENVRFAYPGPKGGPLALDIDKLVITPGERIGILGPVGSGKSTLLRLLSGLYEPQQGRVLLDDLNIRQIDRQTVSEQVGYLQQDTRLFEGTLRENLLIGSLDPGDDAIFTALKRTGLITLVAGHPRGLELPITEGGRGLSGGQRQLVAFTRLLLTRPNIYLLDEPTASMDDDLERRCLGVLQQELTAGKTLVVVSHKMSLLPLVNRLIVVVGNKVVMDSDRESIVKRLSQPPSTRQPAVVREADSLSKA